MDIHQLKAQNQQLKQTLSTAISEAKLNRAVLKRFIDIEIKMLSCDKLSQLIDVLLNDFKNIFKLSVVSLFLHNKEGLAAPLLAGLNPSIARNLSLFADLQEIQSIYPKQTIRAGDIDRELRKKLFPNNPFVLSCVLLPLIHKGRLIGSLHLGAKELNRYHTEHRYEYLERTSALLAVCIENCIIHENLAYLSTTDTLTKISNRHSFDQEIDKALHRANRHSQHLSLLFLDIDHFKQVNDTYGHTSGDQVLKSFANTLKQLIRNTDFLARFGGEEFAILLPNCGPKQAVQLANNLRQKVAEHLFDTLSSEQINISTSIGVCSYSFCDDFHVAQNMTSLSQDILQSADQALYRAKHSGRNKVVYQEINLQHRKASC